MITRSAAKRENEKNSPSANKCFKLDEASVVAPPSTQGETNAEPVRDPETLSDFEKLPKEVAWMVFDRVPEAVYQLRLTSRIINSAVVEYAMQRATVPVVTRFDVRGVKNGEDRCADKIIICTANDLFELRLKVRQTEGLLKKIVKTGEDVFSMCLENLTEDEIAIIGECIGTPMIEEVCISPQDSEKSMEKLFPIFEAVQIDVLIIDDTNLLDDADLKHLLKAVDNYKVRLLTLAVKKIVAADPVSLLLSFSSLVRTLEIVQHEFEDGDNNDFHHVFGISLEEDWPSIILRMFSSGKIDKLQIVSNMWWDFLKKEQAEELMKILPKIQGKKIWFEATCAAYPNGFTERTVNQCRVKVVTLEEHDGLALKIAHLTRANEGI